MNSVLAVNDLINNKLDGLEIPDKMKDILKEVLRAEEEARILGGRDSYKNLGKILQKYADDEDVKEFCSKYDS